MWRLWSAGNGGEGQRSVISENSRPQQIEGMHWKSRQIEEEDLDFYDYAVKKYTQTDSISVSFRIILESLL